jgi:predicted TIM-barrel fold metal-dependent hydrolase
VTEVIDVHVHVGHNIVFDTGQTPDECLAAMDRSGVARAIVSAVAGGRQVDGIADTMRLNDAIAEAVRTHPDRFPIGLAGIEIRHDEKAVDELERAFTQLGLRGMVLHPTFEGILVGSTDVLDPLFELAAKFGGLCLLHATPDAMGSPRAIAELAARYPAVTVIMGHPALTRAQRDEATAAVADRDNVYVDVAYQHDPQNTEALVAALGPDRVLFGSDAPFYDVGATLDSVRRAALSDDARERILHHNAAALIDRMLALT